MGSDYPQPAMYIDGQWIERDDDPVLCPATGERIAGLPHATRDELDQALAAAEHGFETWRATPPAKRARVMLDAMALLRERADAIAPIITQEQGKTLAEAGGEVRRGADLISWDAEEARRTYGRVIPGSNEFRQTVAREPIGPVAAFAPWSAPTSSPGRKVGAALAAGCSMVLKAAEETPGGARELVRCFHDAGLPPGVLNLVFGDPAEISSYLIASPTIRLVTFTGSVPVGKHLTELAAQQMKPVLMELGGHGPVIVCDDADIDRAVELGVKAKYRNAGQVCISPTRFYIQRKHYERFVDAFVEKTRAIRVGNGTDPDTQMGPLAHERRVHMMKELVGDALEHGAQCLAGGDTIGDTGFFYQPTVLANLHGQCRIVSEEPFGPVALMDAFDDLDEAIGKANATPYGLAGYAFTESSTSTHAIATSLQVGHLAINHFGGGVPESPFGGVKESGLGREGGKESLDAYLTTKYVSHYIPTR